MDWEERVCPFCGRKYKVLLIPQEPGFRTDEDERCPYLDCGKVIKTSLENEFYTEEMEGEDLL